MVSEFSIVNYVSIKNKKKMQRIYGKYPAYCSYSLTASSGKRSIEIQGNLKCFRWIRLFYRTERSLCLFMCLSGSAAALSVLTQRARPWCASGYSLLYSGSSSLRSSLKTGLLINESTEQLPHSESFPGVLESKEEGRIVFIFKKPKPFLRRDETQ